MHYVFLCLGYVFSRITVFFFWSKICFFQERVMRYVFFSQIQIWLHLKDTLCYVFHDIDTVFFFISSFSSAKCMTVNC